MTVSPSSARFSASKCSSITRAGIDHGDLALADDVNAGAEIGEGSGILRDDATNTRARLGDAAVFELKVADEGNGHVSSPVSICELGRERCGESAGQQARRPELLSERKRNWRPHIRLVGIDNIYPTVLPAAEHVHPAPVKPDLGRESADQVNLCRAEYFVRAGPVHTDVLVSEAALKRTALAEHQHGFAGHGAGAQVFDETARNLVVDSRW